MKLVESADHPLLVLFGLWHHEHVVPSFRCPAWKASAVKVPSSWWQALQRASSTMGRRAAYGLPFLSVATFWALGAITIRPPLQAGLLAVAGTTHGTFV